MSTLNADPTIERPVREGSPSDADQIGSSANIGVLDGGPNNPLDPKARSTTSTCSSVRDGNRDRKSLVAIDDREPRSI